MSLRLRLGIAFLSFISMFVVTLAIPAEFPGRAGVNAGHDDPGTSHLSHGYIARNVVLGNPIKVCTNVFPISSARAIGSWNSRLDPSGSGSTVFHGTVLDPTSSSCAKPVTLDKHGIDNVLIREGSLSDCGTSDPDILGCYRSESNELRAWNTFVGQIMIIAATDSGDAPFEDGEDLEDWFVTHELGHMLGLGDYRYHECVLSVPLDEHPRDYLVQFVQHSVMSFDLDCRYQTPASRDAEDFALSYVPTKPTILEDESGSFRFNEVVISWDAFNVHVESDFDIQRKNRVGVWESVEVSRALPVPPVELPPEDGQSQVVTVTISAQDGGEYDYRGRRADPGSDAARSGRFGLDHDQCPGASASVAGDQLGCG